LLLFGAFIWVSILTLIGYYIGVNLTLIKEKLISLQFLCCQR